MTAAGMVEEGTIREHILKAGKWRDSVVHAILDANGGRPRRSNGTAHHTFPEDEVRAWTALDQPFPVSHQVPSGQLGNRPPRLQHLRGDLEENIRGLGLTRVPAILGGEGVAHLGRKLLAGQHARGAVDQDHVPAVAEAAPDPARGAQG